MAIAGKRTEEREVPHEPDNYFTFRTISGPELDEADLLGTKRATDQLKDMPDSIIQAQVNQQAAANAQAPNPEREFRGYEKGALVRFGLLAWRGPEYDGMQCDDEHKAMLDAKTMEWAARVVFEMNVRPLGEASGSGSTSSLAGASPRS